MKFFSLFIIYFFLVQISVCQPSFFQKSDSVNCRRVAFSASSIGTSWMIGTIRFSKVWYADYPKSKFHAYNDFSNWLQMDKLGHFYTANKLSSVTSDVFKWSGLNKKKAILLGAGIGLGLQTTLEVLDGSSAEWGFSWSDMTANFLGVISFAAQELLWNEEKFIFKFSYHPTSYASMRPNVLGSNFSQSLLKDYNGQTYWMSFSPSSLMKSSKIPDWLCFSVGYSVNQKLVGDQEVYFDNSTNITYHSKREWLLSLDIDFSRLPIKRNWLKALCKQLNYIKIPFPALIYSNQKLSGYGIYF
jgi:uncharacterized protein YfiM (DUF2279 family)